MPTRSPIVKPKGLSEETSFFKKIANRKVLILWLLGINWKPSLAVRIKRKPL